MAEQPKLTDKQRAFCSEYIRDWNATRAAIAAGYSEKTAYSIGNENLKKPEIEAYIEHIQANLEKEIGISKSMVVKEHMKLAFNSIAHLHNTWIERKEFEELTDEQKACISEIYTRTRRVPISVIDADSGGLTEMDAEVQEIKIKLYDRQKSLDAICKLLGYNAAEKVDHSGDVNFRTWQIQPASEDQ